VHPATPDDVRRALAAVRVWPVRLDPTGDAAGGLRPLAEITDGGLARRVCTRMGRGDPAAVPLRVGQSAVVMGLASRLWSLTVVPAARSRVLVDPAAIRWRDEDGAVELGVEGARGWLDPAPADVWTVVRGVLAPVVGALPLAPRLLWGNVAASLHAVPRVHGLPAAEPLVADLLARAPLAGELEVRTDGRARRRTCCLFWEVPGGGLCGDCVLDRVPAG